MGALSFSRPLVFQAIGNMPCYAGIAARSELMIAYWRLATVTQAVDSSRVYWWDTAEHVLGRVSLHGMSSLPTKGALTIQQSLVHRGVALLARV